MAHARVENSRLSASSRQSEYSCLPQSTAEPTLAEVPVLGWMLVLGTDLLGIRTYEVVLVQDLRDL